MALGGSLPLDQASHISSTRRRSALFSSVAADSEIRITDSGLSSEMGIIGGRPSDDISTLPFDLVKYGCEARLPQTNHLKNRT